jgi:hypothetical protein
MPTPPARLRLRLPVLSAVVLAGALLAPAVLHGTGDAAVRQYGATALKPPIRGLIDRIGEPDPGTESYISAYVVRVRWADLQPTPFGPIVADNAIDQAIARVRLPDMAGRMSLKLRVLAGVDAPEWAKEIGGAPLAYLNNQAGANVAGGTIGRFWLPDYGKAYADLQRKLAHRYDFVPEIREVTVDRCSTIYDELFVRQAGEPQNVAALAGAGYTTTADHTCILQAIDAHKVWRYTTSDVDFSPLPNVLGVGQDLTFTLDAMDYCRASLGARCGLENNALSSAKLTSPKFVVMYQRMAELGGALTFQTATSSRIGDWTQALDAAVAMHALSVELPYGYDAWPAADLAGYARALGA